MPPQTSPTKPATALHIFRPGRHTAMSGQALSFSAADLQATVAAYDPTKHEAPLVVGHPSHDQPAYGWVQSLQLSDGGINATPAQVNADFADMVAGGAFKKISASFYAPDSPSNPVPGVYYLRHVGFLGAQPPAVKGLRPPQFADTEAGVLTFEFAEDQAAADPAPAPAPDPAPESAPPPESVPPPEPKESPVTEQEKAALEAENTRLKTELAATKAAQVHAANLAFCEAQPGVLPAWRAVATATLDHFATQPAPIEFGEGAARQPLAEQFRAMLSALPAPVQPGELATAARAAGAHQQPDNKDDLRFAEAAPERMALHRRICAHATEHNLTYAQADLALRVY